jgi:2,4-didehydro-3-deoxy-L-rhamnonate hydrolase
MTNFALATLSTPDGPAAAIHAGGRYHLIGAVQPLLVEATCLSLLQSWDAAFPLLEALATRLAEHPADGVSEQDAHLLTPVIYPDKLMAVGANYSGHLREMGLKAEKWASMPFFIRPPKTTLVGPGKTVMIPRSTKQFDWECEVAVFLGRRLRHASKAEAAAAVAGYAIGLDLSCRDLIQVDNDLKVDLVRGKAQDTMAPCGPVIMPAKFVPDINDARIQLSVNGEMMMNASTSEMLYKIDEQLSTISEYLTIEPGDILFTGSPSGSAGVHGNRWLRPGDHIHAEIENIGVLDVVLSDEP